MLKLVYARYGAIKLLGKLGINVRPDALQHDVEVGTLGNTLEDNGQFFVGIGSECFEVVWTDDTA